MTRKRLLAALANVPPPTDPSAIPVAAAIDRMRERAIEEDRQRKARVKR